MNSRQAPAQMSLSITSGQRKRRRRKHWGTLKLMMVELLQMTRVTVTSLTLTAPSRNMLIKMTDGLSGSMMMELICLTETAALFQALYLVLSSWTAVVPEKRGPHRTSAQLAGTSTRRQKKWKHHLKINWTMVSGCIAEEKVLIFYREIVNLFPLKHVFLTWTVCCYAMFLTDPNSLTCDQWVLLKKWRPKRAPNTTG